jgi:Sulfotransferase domain
LYWCLGMQASASTWIYNATLKIAAILNTDVPTKGRYVPYRGKLGFLDDPGLHIVKSHGVDGPTEAELGRRATSIIISVRDPRDAVASLMLYHSQKFKEALRDVERAAATCARFAGDPRAIVLRYESRFTEDPATIDRLAAGFGRELPRHDRDRIFEESRRENVEKLISTLEQLPGSQRAGEDLFDLDTQWHKLHAGRTGEIGKWRRTLSEGQMTRIEARLYDWMGSLEYTPTRQPGLIARLMKLTQRAA